MGAQPSDAVRVLIKKYGTNGTHVQKMEEARARLKHLEEGTGAYEIEYQKILDQIRRARGLI